MTPLTPLVVSSLWEELSGQVVVVLAEVWGRSGKLVESPEEVVIEVEPVVVDLVKVVMGKELEERVQVEVEPMGLEEVEVRAHHQCQDLAVEVAATAEGRVRPTFHQAQVQVFLQVKVEVEAGAGAVVEAIEMTKRRERKEKVMVDLHQFFNLSDN